MPLCTEPGLDADALTACLILLGLDVVDVSSHTTTPAALLEQLRPDGLVGYLQPHTSAAVIDTARQVRGAEHLRDLAAEACERPHDTDGQLAPRVALSDPQVHTLRMIASGMTNQEISTTRGVTVRAVEQSVRRLASRIPNRAPSNTRAMITRSYYRLLTGQDPNEEMAGDHTPGARTK